MVIDVKPIEEGGNARIDEERVRLLRPKRQGRLFEEMLFGMRFSHLKMWVEGEKQCNGPKACTV